MKLIKVIEMKKILIGILISLGVIAASITDAGAHQKIPMPKMKPAIIGLTIPVPEMKPTIEIKVAQIPDGNIAPSIGVVEIEELAPYGNTAMVAKVEVEDYSLPITVAVETEKLPETFIMAEVNYTEKQLYCLAVNIYFEARSETLDGMMAVTLVTLNRVANERYPDTICKVVWQNKQFSWTHDGKSDTPMNRRAWEISQTIARTVLNDYTTKDYDFTGGAMWYHADYVKPKWRKYFQPTTKIGAHIFYARY
jgi:hypothetical protein